MSWFVRRQHNDPDDGPAEILLQSLENYVDAALQTELYNHAAAVMGMEISVTASGLNNVSVSAPGSMLDVMEALETRLRRRYGGHSISVYGTTPGRHGGTRRFYVKSARHLRTAGAQQIGITIEG